MVDAAENLIVYSGEPTNPSDIINALPTPILVLDAEDQIRFANGAAQQFFDMSVSAMCRLRLQELLDEASPLVSLVSDIRRRGTGVFEYDMRIESSRIRAKTADVQVLPLPEVHDHLLITLQPRSIALKIDRQLTHRGAARSLAGMAAILAHEVKNPLSGIRGAAQLLEQSASPDDRELTRLIAEETDRICALVDQMEAFSDPRPLVRVPENIHEILNHACKIANVGFARDIVLVERYDPSLPMVLAHHGRLVQVFLNLLKNAAEALNGEGVITLGTAYHHGFRIAVPGTGSKMELPIEIRVTDNGPGIPEDLKEHLFDPFVTTKAGGTGIGLALVAKFVGDHGGIVECNEGADGTTFRVLLPADKAEARQ